MKLVILDRDGVINHDSDAFIKSPEEWQPIDGSLEAIATLNQHGYQVVIATNQSGIARGLYDMTALNEIHEKMHKAVAQVGGKIAAVFFCPHGPDDNCNCRKPKTGMLTEIQSRFMVDLNNVMAVGDAHRDLEAFAKAGCQPVLVKTGKGELTLNNVVNKPLPDNTLVCDDLADAVAQRLQQAQP